MADNKELEVRFAKVEGIVSRINERLNHLSTEVGELRTKIDTEIGGLRSKIDTEIGRLRDKIDTNLRWMIVMWVTVILTIIFK